MTKDELKKLSHDTFFDNEQGGIIGVVKCDSGTVTITNIKENITDPVGLANIVDIQIENYDTENMKTTLLTSNGYILQGIGANTIPTVKKYLASDMQSFCKNEAGLFVAVKAGEIYTGIIK